MTTYNLHQERDTKFCRLDGLPEVRVRWLNREENQTEADGSTFHLFHFSEWDIVARVTYNTRRRISVEIPDKDNRKEVLDYMERAMGGRLIAA